MIPLFLSLAGGTAWAYWSATSVVGGNGASAAASVNQGSTPTANAVGSTVTVNWTASTLSNGGAVTGFLVKRYDAATLVPQAILSACTGAVAATSCVESNVPDGSWVYSVTPVIGTNWQGAESVKSGAVTVSAQSPVAVANSYTVNEDTTLTVAAAGVLTNDTDLQSDPITAVLVTGVASGTLTSFGSDGAFVYVPNPGYNGSDSFTYKANDGVRDSNVVAVTITVTAVNDAPVNTVPAAQQTPKNTNKVFSAANNNLVAISDADAGGSTVQVRLTGTNGTVTLPVLTGLTFSVGDGTSDATMTFTGSITNVNLRLSGATFIPTNNFTGAGTLQILTSDQGNTGTGGPLTDTDSITITVNSLGIFTANQDIGVPPGTAGSASYASGTYTVAGGGHDIWSGADHFQFVSRAMTGDGRLTAKVVSQNQTPSVSNAAKAGVMFRETLDAGSIHGLADITQANGSEFLWRLTTDGVSAATTGTAGIAAPYWVRLTRVGNVLTGERSANGTTWVQQGNTQSVAMGATVYAGLAVTARDVTKLNTATFDNVAITTPPTAVGGTYITNEDTTLNVAASGVLWNDTDPESNALTAIIVSGTTGLTLNANGSFTYVPPANFSGAASFTYRANDGVFDSNTVTVNLTVNPVNDVPSFTKGANQVVFRGAGAQSAAAWASVISQGTGDSGQLVNFITTNDNNSLFSVQPTVSPTGTLSYAPDPSTAGVATVSVRVKDTGGTANGGVDTSAIQTFTITTTADGTGPTGGSIDAGGLVGTGARYAASTTLSLNLNKGTDPGGLAPTGSLVKRATATLASAGGADGSCGTFGSYTLISGGTDPTTPKADTVADQACYSYQYVVSDVYGNPTTYTSPAIKVDLTAPAAPALVHSAFANTYWPGTGSTVYYRPAAATGAFTTTATATDTASGIAGVAYPGLGTNWTSTPGALGVNTYSWSAAPAAPGTKNVTASNNASTVSANAAFTPTADSTAPSTGTVTYANGDTTAASVSVSFTTGTDGGSGIGTRLLQRASATLTGSTCGSYGAFSTVGGGTNPTSPVVDPAPAGNCYKYQYVVSDTVGNQGSAASSANVAISHPGAYWMLDAGTGTSAIDSAGNGNTGTLQAGATWTTGKVGPYAVNLTGATNSFVDVTNPVVDTSESYSVSAWVKPTTTTGFQTYASMDGASISPFYLQLDSGVFKFTTRTADSMASTAVSAVGIAPVAGSWYHLTGVFNKSNGTIELYVDGVSQGTAAFTSPWKATGHTTIGRARWNGGPVDFANAAIDDVHFFDRVLTPTEVTALAATGASYASTISGTSGLLSYWRLGEASAASPITDSKGTNHGSYLFSPTVGAAGAIAGDSDTAASFGSSEDYGSVARQISDDFSIEFWFTSSYNDFKSCPNWWDGAGLVDADASGSNGDFGVTLCAGKVTGWVGNGSGDTTVTSAASYLGTDWHHVVFTRMRNDPGNVGSGLMKLYVDGALVGQGATSNASLTDTATLEFGRIHGAGGAYYSFVGSLDEVAVYNTVLSGATIAAHHAAG